MTFDVLQEYIKDYSPSEKAQIIHAYEFACVTHYGQTRKSGEPYIIHPLYVGCLLAEMNADADTICAGLLHDVIEDGKDVDKLKLSVIFNPTVADLVDGVTKINKIEFNNDKERTNDANTRKIIESLLTDVRIFIIKLADRLHNMMTLEFHSPEKQYEIAKETMELYVPFASLLGEFKVKSELEDLSFKFMNPDEYSEIAYKKKELFSKRYPIRDMVNISISQDFNSSGVPYFVYPGEKSIYSIYKKMNKENVDITDLKDLLELKYVFENDKYRKAEDFASIISSIKHLYSESYDSNTERNYIDDPKLNMYRAIHTSIISPAGFSLQLQFQNRDMYQINTYGLTAYWKMLKKSKQDAKDVMQDKAREVPGFIDFIKELSLESIPDDVFNQEVKESVLKKKVSVIDELGNKKPVPINSTVADYIIKYVENPFNIAKVFINGEESYFNTVINDKDQIRFEFIDRRNGIDYEPFFHTHQGKRLYLKKK